MWPTHICRYTHTHTHSLNLNSLRREPEKVSSVFFFNSKSDAEKAKQRDRHIISYHPPSLPRYYSTHVSLISQVFVLCFDLLRLHFHSHHTIPYPSTPTPPPPPGTSHIPWIVIGFSHGLNVCLACRCVLLMCVLRCKYHWLRLPYCPAEPACHLMWA